jgi:TonB family C-terminal domain
MDRAPLSIALMGLIATQATALAASPPEMPVATLQAFNAYYRGHVDTLPDLCEDQGIELGIYKRAFIALNEPEHRAAMKLMGGTANAEPVGDERADLAGALRSRAAAAGRGHSVKDGCALVASDPLGAATRDAFSTAHPAQSQELLAAANGDAGACVRTVSTTPPPYPPAARRNQEGGIVRIRVWLDRQGTVTDSTVAASSGSTTLDQAALAQAKAWLFDVSACPPPADAKGYEVSAPVTFALPFYNRELSALP